MKHSGSLYSDEVLTEPPKDSNAGWWKWALAIILVLLFVYRSTRPVLRLSADPPPSFYDYNRSWNQEKRQQEKRLAQAYWKVAVQRIQTYYSPSSPLPEDPPPQFRIGAAAENLEADVAASRVHYWYRLRDAWRQDDSWVVSYGWSTDWVESTLDSLPYEIPRWVESFFQGLTTFFNNLANIISLI